MYGGGEVRTWVESQGLFFRRTVQIHIVDYILKVGFGIIGFIAVVGGGGVVH